jgi:phytoene dehydrogenase-like protein
MYDVLIIGAGMSGLAAGIRLAMYDQHVCILERHYAVGGLNSYYRLDGRNYDVGLHAITNFAPRGAKQGPLPRLLRQLRMDWGAFELAEQRGSRIAFPGVDLRFNNNVELLAAEVARAFPKDRDNFRRLLDEILTYDKLDSPQAAASTRQVLSSILSEPQCVEMLMCPLMFYGSPNEHDLDFGAFSVLFRAIYMEGMARPPGGVRVILKHLIRRYKELGGELRLRAGVQQIVADGKRTVGAVLDDGSELQAKTIISSAGWHETMRLCQTSPEKTSFVESAANPYPNVKPATLSFVESICTLDCQPRDFNLNDTILFYNDSAHFDYSHPSALVDVRSGIVCSPNNYEYEQLLGTATARQQPTDGTVRMTALANYDAWAALSAEEYQREKQHWHEQMQESAVRFVPDFRSHVVAHDMFTPTTITRFTGHDGGAVYGVPQKRYDASTHLQNLLICGTDQGYVGVIGTITSGIQVANTILRP